MPNTKIAIEPIDLNKQQILEAKLFEVELAPDRFIYRLKVKTLEPQKDDDALPWIEVDNDFHIVNKRAAFAGIEKWWHQVDKRWKIMLSFDGIGSDLMLYFKRQKDCEAVFDQLVEYFFGKE